MSTIYSIALKLSLDGVNQLKNSFSVATQEIKKSSSGINNVVKDSLKQMKEYTTGAIGQAVSTGAMIAGITKAIKTGIEFEDTFLRATAKIKGGVKQGSEEFKNLENLVLSLGAKTEFSTTQAGQGLEFWAKAGKTTNEIMELLPKSLDMATASGLDLARASDIISDALGIFNLNASDMNQLSINTDRIMDNMSKTATMTNTSVEELFETSKIAGGIFTTAGQSIETFNSAVAILADNSMKGSVAGTNLRGIMAKLSSPVDRAKDILDSLGISVSDSNGNMKDFANILDELKLKTDSFGNAQKLAIYKVLVGQEAMNGLNFLVKEGGDKLREYRTQLQNAKGSTKDLANLFRTNTKADLSNFTSAIEGLAIGLFKYLQPSIKLVLQTFTGLIDLFNTITADSKTLKVIFISLGIVILGTFAPISATIIGVTLLFAGLVKAFQYCYTEFEWFRVGIDGVCDFIKNVFFITIDSIKGFIDNTINVFKSFSDGFGIGFINVLTLIRQGIYTLIITPIKWILIALSKLPSKLGGIGKAGLEALDNFERDSFQYSFNTENKDGENKDAENKDVGSKENNKNNIQPSTINLQHPNLPNAKDVTPAVLQTKFGFNQDNRANGNNADNINQDSNSNNNQTSMKQISMERLNNNRSILDINITAPKNYNTNYSLNNVNSPLLINVNGKQ